MYSCLKFEELVDEKNRNNFIVVNVCTNFVCSATF